MVKKKKGLLVGILMFAAAICMLFAACGGAKKIKIDFDTDGGPAVESVLLKAGETYTLPVPEWEGHSFEGWYTNAEHTGSAVTEVTAEKKTTFYAKWEQLYAITLQLGGGTLAGGTTLHAKAGTNIATFMADYIPTLKDHQFGEWLVGGTPLSADATLTTAGIALTAHYKVAYTAELHLQNLTLDDYDKAEEDYLGYAYAGELPVPDVKGFELVAHEGSTSQKPLTENVAENRFVFYMDRKTVNLYLMANHEGASLLGTDSVTVALPYGTEIELPVPFSFKGYCLVGWSASPQGEVKYRSSYLDSVLYNGSFGSDPFKFEEGTVLYAVWVQGYTDLFGGGDYIFRLSDDSEEVYLLRGGVMFQGSYTTQTGKFIFTTPDDDALVAEGKLNSDGTFTFYSDDRDKFTYTYFKNGVGKNDKIRIILDGYNGISYVDNTLTSVDKESKGAYTIDENGLYHVSYTEGPLAGQEFVYALTVSGQNGAIFMVRDDEELGWGAIPRGAVYNGRLTYYTSLYSITLNGFGNALYTNSDGSTTSYYYVREDDIITLLNAYGMEVAEAHLTTIDETRAYLLYSSEYDVTYTEEGGTATLKPDGMCNATYTDADGKETKGLYSLYSSEFGTLVQFFGTDGAKKLFLTHSETETVEGGEEGKTEQKVNYLFKEVPATYSEIRYLQDGGIYYAPLLVLDDEEVGKASVYGYVSKNYIKVLTGTYTHDTATGVYTFTTTEAMQTEGQLSSPVDLLSLRSFTFSIDTVVSSSGALTTVMYWHSMTLKNDEGNAGEETKYDAQYTNGDSTITVTQGFAVYETDGETVRGVLTTDESGISALYDSLNRKTYYFKLDEEKHTFTVLDGLLGSVYALLADGTVSRSEMLTFDGKDGATYTVTTANGDGTSTTKEYKGTYSKTQKTTPFGYYIYHFEESDQSFDFILAAVSSSSIYFAKFNEAVEGDYTFEGATLTLDGFGFRATYTDAEGVEHEGLYLIPEENVVELVATDGYFYFDLKDGKTFTVRDEAYGTYLYVKNQSPEGSAFRFDGYGNLTVTDLTSEAEEDPIVGTYEKLEDGSYLLTYKKGAEDVKIVGRIGAITISSTTYRAFWKSYEEVVMSFVNEDDWSVLKLGDRGEATRYDAEGFAETGSYVIITDTMFYYVNSDGSDACIYTYDKAKATATPVNNTERAYYTSDFEAMLFTRYGFMIMDGVTRYYYNVVNGNVLLYHQDPTDSKANKYGFVEDDFFKSFEDTKTIGDKVYYQSYDFELTFARKAGETKYPIPFSSAEDLQPLGQLKFSPTGSAEFTDSDASVWIKDKEYSCTVRRVLGDDKEYHMYILVPAGVGNFVFEIDLTYQGDEAENDYSIESMRSEIVLYDTVYLNFLLNYLMQGQIISNSFGVITLTTPYDDSGVAQTPKASGVFGETLKALGLTDTKGDVISFTDAEYTYANGIYSVTFEGDDEYKYSIYFAVDQSYYNYIGMLGYGIYAFTRHETPTADGGYTVDLERILFTESSSFSVGGYWKLALSKDGTELEYDAGYILDGKVYYFVRTKEEETDKVTSSKVYIIEFTQETSDVVGEEPDPLAPYKSATVTEKTLTVAYDAEEKNYVEYDDEHTFVCLHMGTTTYLFEGENCTYNEETETFTLKTASGKAFSVKVDNNVLTVTEIAAEEDETTAEE